MDTCRAVHPDESCRIGGVGEYHTTSHNYICGEQTPHIYPSGLLDYHIERSSATVCAVMVAAEFCCYTGLVVLFTG